MPGARNAPKNDEPVYRLRLVDGVNGAQFNVGGEEISLDADSPVFETKSFNAFRSARDLPFLEEAD